MKPLVSVIVPTYKRKDTLRSSLDSLLSQSYSPVEIIVVDDNADIEWNNHVQNILKEYPSVVYICNSKNLGSAESRNVGIRAAKGDYITFLDDDDIYLPEKIDNQLQYMIESGADYSITDLYLYSQKDKLLDKRIRNYIKETDPKVLLQYHLMYNMTGTDSLMFRKEYLLNIGCFPPIDSGDEFYLMKEAIVSGGKFVYVPYCFIKAYVHTDDNGMSYGDGKVSGEKVLFNYKKTFFNEMNGKSKRYIKVRHFAVLAYAYLRMKNYALFILYSAVSFAISPISSVKILLNR